MKRCLIVMVEDNPADVYLVRETLRANGVSCELKAYSDGEAALASLLEPGGGELPNLILLDWNLPAMDGADVLRILRRRPSLEKLPIAVLTSSTAAADRDTAAQLGATRFIHKPNTLDEFISGVGRHLRELIGPPALA